MMKTNAFEIIIIGGSYAGLSAAMALGRSLKKTLVIDSGQPCNRQTPRSHNFLTRDGQPPGQVSSIAKEQVEQYKTVTFYEGLAKEGMKTSQGFEITTKSGPTFTGKKLIFATGIKDLIPDIPGFSACWGISIIHCPYCHGYEYRSKKTGIMADSEKAFHLAPLISNLTDKLTILSNGRSDFTADQIDVLNKHKINVIESEVAEVEHKNGQLKSIVFTDGKTLELDALYAGVPFSQHTNIPELMGCGITDEGYIAVDEFQKTNLPGIYACGDNCSPFRSISNAVLTGSVAGAIANMELTNEQF